MTSLVKNIMHSIKCVIDCHLNTIFFENKFSLNVPAYKQSIVTHKSLMDLVYAIMPINQLWTFTFVTQLILFFVLSPFIVQAKKIIFNEEVDIHLMFVVKTVGTLRIRCWIWKELKVSYPAVLSWEEISSALVPPDPCFCFFLGFFCHITWHVGS